jgi:hypothetical protein
MRTITFRDFVPSARGDGQPWTRVRIDESASNAGPWSVVEVIALSPVDADPTLPQPRTFSTNLASDFASWFKVTFLDAGDNELPTTPVLARGTDLRDVRTLIPRTRRMIDGPGPGNAALTDEFLTGAIADAASTLIMLTAGTFGVTLDVSGRDSDYLAPNAWRFSAILSADQETLVCLQAAIEQVAREVALGATSEGIKDEGQEWTYSRSATLMRDWLKALIGMRDAAMQQLADAGMETDVYTSFIGIRDSTALANAESWVDQAGLA